MGWTACFCLYLEKLLCYGQVILVQICPFDKLIFSNNLALFALRQTNSIRQEFVFMQVSGEHDSDPCSQN